jgi:threonine synthase
MAGNHSEPYLVDPVSGRDYPVAEVRWRSDEGRPLWMSNLPGITRDDIDRGERSLWRYRKSLPVAIDDPVSMGEGCTPLIERTWAGRPCHFKLEWFAPTGSFKDRGAAVMLSFLRQQGVGAVLEDSSGNGGAAIAAYGAVAGIGVRVLAPAYTQAAKIAQIRAFGADVRLVEGPREASEEEAIRQSEEIFYASHNWHPFFLQGTKTLGYELWEDLGFRVPDNIIIPVGAGSNVLGCDLAFSELMRAGETARLPRLFCAQPANCAPIHARFQSRPGDAVAPVFAPTIAEGTAIKRPVRLEQVIDAVRRSGGNTVAVSEEGILAALKKLVRAGLYVEPTSATAAAAFDILCESGEIKASEVTVAVLTGSGLKASAFMTETFAGG